MTPEQLAQAISNFCNRMGTDQKAVARALANDHPTLQQGIMRLFVAFVQEMAQKSYTDARNERSVELARQITALWQDSPYGPPLPLI